MYESIRVANFRSLRQMKVQDLGRLNLFVGPNNVGKTSLLEAVWLLQSPANIALTFGLALARGLTPLQLQQNPDSESVWHPLFYGMQTGNPIDLAATRVDGTEEALDISLSGEWVGDIETNGNGAVSSLATSVIAGNATAPPQTLVYRFTGGGINAATSTFSFGFGRANARTDPVFTSHPDLATRLPLFLFARQRTSPEELAARFTKAQDTVGTESLVRSLRVLEPDLRDMSIGYYMGDRQPSLRAHLNGLDRPMPLQLLGDGVGRLADILLAVPTVRNGVLLVDEIENGLYYRNLIPSWRAINITSREANVQLFATTHSLECVRAVVEALSEGDGDDFRLHRLERDGGDVRVVTYGLATARETLALNLEFR